MIRRWAAVLLMLALLVSAAAADGELRGYSPEEGYVYVTFGRYWQTIDGGIPDDDQQAWQWHQTALEDRKLEKKGERAFDPEALEKQPILWRVLSADEERIYLLSEYILFAAPLHTDRKAFKENKGNFARTEIFATLNGPFAQEAFTEEERAMLAEDPELGMVFLPSADEVSDPALGFAKDVKKRVKVRENDGTVTNNTHTVNEERKAWATEYAIRVTGAYVYPVQRGNHSPYWMRDPVSAKANPSHGKNTKNFGQIGTYDCTNPEEGARPGVLLIPGSYRIEGGSGTKEDPYRLVPAGEAE